MTPIESDWPRQLNPLNKFEHQSKPLNSKMATAYITANEMQLRLLLAFCKSNGIGIEIPTPPSDTAYNTYMSPSAPLKQFCGAEMMNLEGKMKPASALEYIMTYAKRNNLLVSTMVQFDTPLSEIFGRPSIECTDLPAAVNNLFAA
jgi:hypothetical protein